MAGTPKRIAGPAYIAAAAANIYTPPASTIYTVIRQIHVANRTGSAITFSLFVGATAGSAPGTELFGTKTIAPNGEYTHNTYLPMNSTDFLTGVASVASSLVITVAADQYVV